ncbi:MAG: TRAP transporter fused permease subunit [Desulfobacula sp.]|nr:TRAP transporter fused permease subunit [Desulfobacula sp.]
MPVDSPLLSADTGGIEPNISSGKYERGFSEFQQRFVNLGFAITSALIIFWTIDVTGDAVIQRSLYLMLIFVLCAICYPFTVKGPSRVSLVLDTIIILLSILGSLYVIYNYDKRFLRLSNLTFADIFFGVTMIIIGLDIGRRVIGWALTLVAACIIFYALIGKQIPGTFGHPGFDVSMIVSQVYSGLEGYYGMATRFMRRYVAPFIILGAFLEKTGAGDFFMNLAFSLTRGLVGGPAKAAVVGSALMGSISGSAIANVSSTGCFTIPMMKRIGYRPHVAAAIEAAASTGGQIMPPIMGAVAFIMVEFTQIPYMTIVKTASIPILLYFITVYVFIHFEAKKYKIGVDDTIDIQPVKQLMKTGWPYFFVLIMIMIVMVMGLSPAIAALSGIISLITINSIISRNINFKLIYESLVLGGKYSLSIGSIVACIGIILALVGLTGVGLKFSWFLADLSQGSAFLAIIVVGLISMILGMGLPSGPAYIVLAITAGPALTNLGFPLLTAHLILVWYSIDSEITPPVGLASITAAGIARSSPMKTMFTAFKFAKGLYILPFMFYYRPGILLEGHWLLVLETIGSILFGLIAFVAVLENYLYRKTTLPERIILLAAAVGLLAPPLVWNGIGSLCLLSVVLMQKKIIKGK